MKNFDTEIADLQRRYDKLPASCDEFCYRNVSVLDGVASDAIDLLKEMLPLIPKQIVRPHQAPDGSWVDEDGNLRSGNGCYADPSEYDH